MSSEAVRIPDIGEAADVEVIEICVGEGDAVAVDDALIVIESDKASMEVPSTVAGTVRAMKLSVGDRVTEGDALAEIETADASGAQDAPEGGDTVAPARGEDEASREASPETSDPSRETAATTAESGPAPAAADGASASAETQTVDVQVPDIGEAGEVAVVEVLIAPGDRVAVDDGLVVLESDKATMEVPSTATGTVREVALNVGDTVEQDTLVARVETQAEAGRTASEPPADGEGQAAPASESASRSKPAPEPERASSEPATERAPEPAAAPAEGDATDRVYAGPAVRRMARELGVELGEVTGSGPKNRILKEDVQSYVKSAMSRRRSAPAGGGIPAIPSVDFSRFGEVEHVPMGRIRRAGATNLQRAWLNLPHVTHHDEADVSELEAFRQSLKAEAAERGVKLTPLALILKACQHALAAFPRFKASLDESGEQLVYKHYCHLGIAVDTDEGLMVPVIRDVDHKGVWTLAAEIMDLSERARAFKLKPDEMRGGTFSVSSLGALGGTGFTPIINAPEVAILGVAQLATRPVWRDGAFVPREMLPLSLSYDHRVVNGAEAARFVTHLGGLLGDLRRVIL